MKKLTAWLPLLLALLLLSGCGLPGARLTAYDVQYLDYFDTFTTVTIYAESREQFEEYEQLLQSELKRCHQLFDIYHTYEGVNNLKTINDHAGAGPVTVDPAILELLTFSREEYEKTDGRVNVAMGSVLSVWHDYRQAAMDNPSLAQIPDMRTLRSAAEHTDMETVQIDPAASTVCLPDPVMRLDAGAVAKGYTAQRLSEKLREAGVTSALISLGGNVQTIGRRGDGKPWRVGVQNPDTQSAQSYLYALNLENMALVTSGSYQRYYEVDGVRYHHIIHPDTLMPWDRYVSVTILTKNGAEADALSTAVFNMEEEEGLAFIESLADTEALWVRPDGSQMESSGFHSFVSDT